MNSYRCTLPEGCASHHSCPGNNGMAAVLADALYTEFAPAERFSHKELVRQAALFQDPSLVLALDVVASLVLILNSCRQIVFTNGNVRALFGLEDDSTILGLRPGELLQCENAAVLPGGCGTCARCRQCGAVAVILSSLDGKETQGECRIVRRTEDGLQALEFKVKGTPHLIGDEHYSIIVLDDISHEKRRRAMERIFFHDVLNTAGGLATLVELLGEEAEEPLKSQLELVHQYFATLLDEVKAQRLLLSAENNELDTQQQELDSLEFLRKVRSFYEAHPVAEGRQIEIHSQAESLFVQSDPILLWRVLGNMTKNALEAISPGECVTLNCFPSPKPEDAQEAVDGVVFQVHNPGVIPRPAQLQIFQRSFSTKGQDRGLGTWSILLLTEHYLKGHASFHSDEESGTTFFVELPLNP